MRGGKRQGAGTKEGSVRPNFAAFLTAKEIREAVQWVKENYQTDSQLKIWYLDHVFGKAIQPIANPEGETFKIEGVNITVRK